MTQLTNFAICGLLWRWRGFDRDLPLSGDEYTRLISREDAVLRIIGENGCVLAEIPLKHIPLAASFVMRDPEEAKVKYELQPPVRPESVVRWSVPEFVGALRFTYTDGTDRWVMY